MPNRQEVFYQDFSARLRPRLLYNSKRGPYVCRTKEE